MPKPEIPARIAAVTLAIGGAYFIVTRHNMEKQLRATRKFATILRAPSIRSNDLQDISDILTDYCTEKQNVYYEYGPMFLANHLSMGCIALYKLGATKDTVRDYAQYYSERLESPQIFARRYLKSFDVIDNENEFTESNIKVNDSIKLVNYFRGERRNLNGIYRYLMNELNDRNSKYYDCNMKLLVSDYFELVNNLVCSSAYHAIIPLGYGISANHKETMIEGLSYLMHSGIVFDIVGDRYNFTTDNDNGNDNDSSDVFIGILNKIKQDGKLKSIIEEKGQYSVKFQGALEQGLWTLSQFAQAEISEYFAPIVPILQGCDNIEDMCDWVLKHLIMLYTYSGNDSIETAQYNDFFLLHGVTSCYAMSHVLRYLYENKDMNKDKAIDAIRKYIHSIGGTYVNQHSPNVSIPDFKNVDANTGILEEQIANTVAKVLAKAEKKKEASENRFVDEHVYKLMQVVLESLDKGIINHQIALDAINKVQCQFQFKSLLDK